MTHTLAKIERAKNGFEVEMCDPKIKQANMGDGPYKDPYVKYVFKTSAEVLAFMKENLDKAVPMEDEYESSFNEAMMEEDDG
jgi:hypothetical protein